MSKYTTGEIAKLCGVSVRTVQYYDERGILIPSELSEGGRRLYSEDDYKKIISRSKVDQWDIIISMIGAYCGFCCIESSTQTDYAIKNVGLFKIGDELKCKWLYYYLTSPLGKQQLSILRSGSSQPYISLNALRNLEIPNPNKEVMIPIVSILQSIDSKIELNRRINDNLI